MTRIINIHTGRERIIEKPPASECSICNAEFVIEEEGGMNGSFGILPVSFCPFCFTSIIDMVKQLSIDYEEEEKEENI